MSAGDDTDAASTPPGGAAGPWEEDELAGAAADDDGPDRVGPDAAGSDEVGRDGVRAGGVAAGGVAADEAGADGVGADGVGADEAAADGVGADDAGVDRAGADDARADHAGGDRAGADDARADHAGGDRAGADDARADHAGGDRAGADDAGVDRAGADLGDVPGDGAPSLDPAGSRGPAADDERGPSAPEGHAAAARRSRALRLTKDLDLLRGLAADRTGEGLGVVRLATQIGRDKSQVSRSLRALVETGLVERDPATGRYHLGLELYALAAATAERRLLSVAPDVLRHLAGELDETVHLCTLHGIDVLTLRSESPPARATAWGAWEGETAPAHATSAGRVLLAGLSPAALRDRYRAAELAGTAPRSRVQRVEDLADVLAEVQAAGTSVVREEHEEGAIGVSAPVHDFRGERVAAINVSGERRLMEPRLDDVVARVASTAVRLSRMLGARTTADGDLPRRPT